MSELEHKAERIFLQAGRRGFWRASALLLAGLILTALAIGYMKSAVEAAEKREFDFNCNEIKARIMERLKVHETILRGGAAFYANASHISRQEWHRFVKLQQLELRFPGIQGIGFALPIPREKVAQHIQEIRAEGFPAYKVQPEGERENYSSIIFLEPFTDRNLRAFGYDMLSEPIRRAAMEQARDQNETVLSGKVMLVQETGWDIQAGTLMYVPAYRREMPVETVEQRRAALLGWVYSPFRMKDLMQGITEGRNLANERQIHLKVFDGWLASPAALLYDSLAGGNRPPGGPEYLTLQRGIVSAGRPWTLFFARADLHESAIRYGAVWAVLLGGTSTSLLLAGLFFSLLNTQFKARQIAEELTKDLRASEQKYHAIADYSLGWETWFDPEGKILWVSPGVERITGYSPAEILILPNFIQGIMAQKDNSSLIAKFNDAIRGGKGNDLEFQLVRKDGTKFWLSMSWQPVVDAKGNAIGVRVSGRDVTELKQTMANLDRANWVVEQAGVSIIITNSCGNIEYVNAEFTRVTGYSKAEALDRNPRFLQSGHTRLETYQELWRTLKAGCSWKGEFQNRRKNGEPYWETVAISPIRDANGRVTHYVGIKQDVSERKKLQLALQESEARFAQLASESSTVVWEVDAQGLYTYVSPVSEPVLGYRPEEMVGRMHFYDLYPDSDRAALKMAAFAFFERKEPFQNLGNAAQTKDGRRLCLSTSGSPLLNADASLLGYRGSDVDITARRQAEKAAAEHLSNFRTFFESMTDMIFVGSPDGRLIYTNQAVTRTLGFSPEELATMHVLDVHPTDRRQEAETIFGAMLRGERGSCPLPLRCKDGGLVPVDTHIWFGRWNGADCIFGISKNLSAEQEAQQRFERLFRNNPALMALSSLPDQRFHDVNDAFLKALGYSMEDVLGKTSTELNLFPQAASQAEIAKKLQRDGRIANVEMQVRRKGGGIIVGLFSGEVIKSQGQQFILTVMNDITEMKRMEEALKEAGNHLQMAVQAGGVGIWNYDVVKNMLDWDAQMFRLYGITRKHFGGAYDAWLAGVHPEDRQRGDEEIQLALRGEKNFDTEFRVVWPDGSIHNIRALALVQRDAAGQPVRMVGTNWDLTAERQAAAALRWNRELLQLMSGSSPLAFLVVDNRTDSILYFNQRFCEIWGIEHLADRLRRGELKNNDIIPECLAVLADVPAFAASCAPLQDEANRCVVEDEIAFTRNRTVRRFSTQIRDAEDRYYGRFYIFEDISERKRREAETTAMLEKEREVSEIKTRFISVTSHEFRTPMAAAMGSVDLLINHFDRFVPAKRHELLTRVNSSLLRMATMLDEILLLNRLEEKRIKVHLTSVDFGQFLHDLVEEIRLGDRDEHRFKLHVPGNVVPLAADSKLLHHIFSNVLSNAVRYSPANTLITVRMEVDALQVQVAIEDQGIGILPADRERIFEPFERGSNVGQIAGTGLGLNIVKRMMGMISGTIAVDAIESGGTRFMLVFARQPAPIEPA